MKTKILMVALMLLAMTPAIQAKSSTKTVAHRGPRPRYSALI